MGIFGSKPGSIGSYSDEICPGKTRQITKRVIGTIPLSAFSKEELSGPLFDIFTQGLPVTEREAISAAKIGMPVEIEKDELITAEVRMAYAKLCAAQADVVEDLVNKEAQKFEEDTTAESDKREAAIEAATAAANAEFYENTKARRDVLEREVYRIRHESSSLLKAKMNELLQKQSDDFQEVLDAPQALKVAFDDD